MAAVIAFTLAVLVSACTSARSAPAATTPIKLRVGVAVAPPPALPESALWLARDLGFYKNEGLDVDIVELEATPSLVTAMRTGDVDLGDINYEDVIRLTATKSLEMRTISSASGRNFFMVVGKNSITSVSELRGHSYAIARVGSQDHVLTSKVLAIKGVPADAVDYVSIGAPSVRAQALAAGQVDATTLSLATWLSVQKQSDLKVLVDVDDYFNALPLVNKGNAVTTHVLSEKTEALRRFTAALIKTSRYLAENKSGWVDAMAKLRPEMARTDLEYLWDQFGSSWAVNGQLNLRGYQTSNDFLYEHGSFNDAPKIDAREWVDTQFVDAALKELGVYADVDDPGRPIE